MSGQKLNLSKTKVQHSIRPNQTNKTCVVVCMRQQTKDKQQVSGDVSIDNSCCFSKKKICTQRLSPASTIYWLVQSYSDQLTINQMGGFRDFSLEAIQLPCKIKSLQSSQLILSKTGNKFSLISDQCQNIWYPLIYPLYSTKKWKHCIFWGFCICVVSKRVGLIK